KQCHEFAATHIEIEIANDEIAPIVGLLDVLETEEDVCVFYHRLPLEVAVLWQTTGRRWAPPDGLLAFIVIIRVRLESTLCVLFMLRTSILIAPFAVWARTRTCRSTPCAGLPGARSAVWSKRQSPWTWTSW